MGNSYSTYLSQLSPIPANICILHVEWASIYGINCPEEMVQGIIHIYKEVFNKDIKIEILCPQITKLICHTICLISRSVVQRVCKMFCKIQKLFYQSGWKLVSSPMLTYGEFFPSWFYEKDTTISLLKNPRNSNELCIIGIGRSDKLYFIDFPKSLETSVVDCIRQNWARDIQRIKREQDNDTWWVKLRGYPWSCNDQQSLDARFLILCLIKHMSQFHWRLLYSACFLWRGCDFIFFRCIGNGSYMDAPPPMVESFFMLALMDQKYIYILGGDDSIKNVIAKSCSQHEIKGVESVMIKHNYPSVKLVSKIWSRRNEDEMRTRMLVTLLLQDLTASGWFPLESIGCSLRIDGLSSITFVRMIPARMMYFCLCPRKYRSICLINATEDVQNTVINTFIQQYPIGQGNMRRSNYGVAISIDFEGDPFRSDSTSTVIFQHALAAVINVLKCHGWNLMMKAITSDEIYSDGVGESSTFKKWSPSGLWFSKILN